MDVDDFDLFILGAGSGGVRAARLTAELGFKVGICEEDRYGGTCVIRGCIPKKLFVQVSDFKDYVSDALNFGWDLEKFELNWKKFLSSKKLEISRLENVYKNNLLSNGVHIFNSKGFIIGRNKIKLDNGKVIKTKKILISVGSTPYLPKINGIEHTITSNEILDLEKIPKRLFIYGGGYIACEFSSIFNFLGSKVIHAYRGKKLLNGFDDDLREHVTFSMKNKGINFQLEKEVDNFKKNNDKITVNYIDGGSVEVDVVLSALGRKPNTKNIGLEKLGVKLNKDGAIIVNDNQETTVENVFAIGDVTDRLNLTPVAIRDANVFVQNVFNNNNLKVDHDLVPTAVFCRPEIGVVGKTEKEARKDHSIDIYKTKFKPMYNIFAKKDELFFMKLIVDKVNKKILGCHLCGKDSAEMIQMLAVAIKMGATKNDLENTCALHPTLAEELITIK